jgi:transcriptional regulator with XRE-family HTH domain
MPKSEGQTIHVPQLQRLRLRAGLTQRELALRSGVSKPTITRAEMGQPIRANTIRRLAYELGVRPQDLTREPSEDDSPIAVAV